MLVGTSEQLLVLKQSANIELPSPQFWKINFTSQHIKQIHSHLSQTSILTPSNSIPFSYKNTFKARFIPVPYLYKWILQQLGLQHLLGVHIYEIKCRYRCTVNMPWQHIQCNNQHGWSLKEHAGIWLGFCYLFLLLVNYVETVIFTSLNKTGLAM